jgi:hypothetical protein
LRGLLRGVPGHDAPAGVPKADIHYLANLCHNCGACYHACQYAPPHEFAVNIPQAMAKVRVQTYGDYAFPPRSAAVSARGLTMALALAGGLALFLLMVLAMRSCCTRRWPATSTRSSRTTCWRRCSAWCSCSRSSRWASG